MEKKISIIIPTFKPGDYLFQCLDSIESQTLEKNLLEVLIVLNGEKSPYWEMIHRWTESHSLDAKILYTEIAGVSNARNLGMRDSIGDFVCFVDDDDILSPSYLEELLKVSDSQTMGIANSFNFKGNINERGRNAISNTFSRVSKMEKDSLRILNCRSYFSSPVAKLIPRNLIGNQCFNTKLKVREDALFMIAISHGIKHLQCTHREAIYYIRKREGSATSKYIPLREICSISFLFWRELTKVWCSHPFRYNPWFMITRYLAPMKHNLNLIKNNLRSGKS